MESSMTTGQLIKFSLSKLLYEMFGTFVMTMLFITARETGGSGVLLAGLWIMTIFCWKISGSHFNPAISIAYIFRKDRGGLPAKLAVFYMLAQCLGAFLGALMMNYLSFNLTEMSYSDNHWARAIVQESLGSFIVVFFFMTQTEEKMFFSKEKAINCFIIAASYVAARAMFFGSTATPSVYGACLNPAMALGITFAALINNGWSVFRNIWIYPVMPFIGSLAALLFYEFVFKKTQEILDHSHNDDVHDENNEDALLEGH